MRKLNGYGPSLIVLTTAAIVLVAGPIAIRRLTYEQTRVEISQASDRLASNDVLRQINQAYRDIATIVEPSVVHVSAQQVIFAEDGIGPPTLGLSTGSGWVYDDLGHIVTNHHVVQDAQRIEVQLYNGDLREAMLIGADATTDIAVIKVGSGNRGASAALAGSGLHPAKIANGDREPVKQGDLVFAFGSPFDFRFSMSSGVVSGKGRSVGAVDDFGNRLGYENFIQVDAAINPGNSGGPLTDFRGQVIGMNTAIATGRRNAFEDGQFSGIGLAIPMDMIVPVVSQIIETGHIDKGFVGVTYDAQFDPADAQARGLSGLGVRLRNVERDGPAFEAGVRSGDVITQVNGSQVISGKQLQSLISSMLPGDVARLSIWRPNELDGSSQTFDINVTVKKLDMLRRMGEVPLDQPRDSMVAVGIARMATSTQELAREHHTRFVPGVMLLELVEGTELARQVEPGSVIVDVMGRPVKSTDDFIRALQGRNLLRIGPLMTVVQPDGNVVPVPLRVQ